MPKAKKKAKANPRKSPGSKVKRKAPTKTAGLIRRFKTAFDQASGSYPPTMVLKALYGEYKKLSPEQQAQVKQALIKTGIALLA